MIGVIALMFLGACGVILYSIFSRMSSLVEKIQALESDVARILRASRPPTTGSESAGTAPTFPSDAPSAQSPPHVSQPPGAAPTQPLISPVPIPAPRPIPIQPAAHIQPPAPSRSREEWESFIGGKLLNRIGALALVIGIGFFLKYAFDNNWITESMRVLIGLLTGVGILLGAARTHNKGFQIFSQGLFGAGISILYLSVYASFNFYHLVSQFVAFGFMAGITVAAFTIALRYDSLAIALLAFAGGFLTPFLLSTGTANEVGLFTYIAILEGGLLALTMKKPNWIILEPCTLFATYLVFSLWHQEYYSEDALTVTIFFLSVFWGSLFAADVMKGIRRDNTQAELRHVIGILNVGIYYMFMYVMIEPHFHKWMGGVTLAVCLVYLANALYTGRRQHDAPRIVAQNVLTSMLLLIIATAIQFEGFTTVIYWSIEAVIVLWCAVRWNLRYVLYFSLGLLIACALKLTFTPGAFTYYPLNEFTLIFNYRALTYAILAFAFCSAALLLRRNASATDATGDTPDEISDQVTNEPVGKTVSVPFDSSALQTILHAGWSILLFILMTIEVNDWFGQHSLGETAGRITALEYAKMMTLICCWTVYSLPFGYLGLKLKSADFTVPGLIILCVTLMMALIKGISFSPIENFYPILNLRMLAVMVALSGSYLHVILLNQLRSEFEWIREVVSTIIIMLVLLFLWLLTGEIRDVFEQQLSQHSPNDRITRIENLEQLSLSGLWLLYGIGLMIIGIWRRARGLRLLAMLLLGVSILKIFVYDLSSLETLYRIFSFIGLGVILLVASYLYQKYKSAILEPARGEDGSVEKA